ncbi:MAG: LysM peptidoglycan-binding domain-containing protein [bacterium]|nr:LysM peptidoglycan-binding domain-containing protein [bacterium]
MRFVVVVLLTGLLFSITLPNTGYSQTPPSAGGTCPAVVERALVELGQNCAGLGRNAACYGFFRVNALFNQPQPEDFFSQPADQTPLQVVDFVQAAPLDELTQQWGVALLHVQANVPNTLPGQAVPFLLLGDTEARSAVPADEAFIPAQPPITFRTANPSNLRTLPDETSNILLTVLADTRLESDARSADGAWLRTSYDGQVGWINRDILNADDALDAQIDALPVYEAPAQTPMQAFYFRTGIGQPACFESPSLLVAQGPERFRVELTANGAQVIIGSTIALRTLTPDAPRAITTIDGTITAAAFTPDGRLIWAEADGSARLDGRLLASAGDAMFTAFAFSPDDDLIAGVRADGQAVLWPGAGEALVLPSEDARSVAFSPDGRFLAVGTDNAVEVFDLSALPELTLVETFDAPGDVLALRFDAEGLLYAVADVAVLRLDMNSIPATSEGLTSLDSVRLAAINEAATLAAVVRRDGQVEIFNLLTGERVISFLPQGGAPVSLTFGRQRGERQTVNLAIEDSQGQIQLWELTGTTPDDATVSLRTIIDGTFADDEGEVVLEIPGALQKPSFSADGGRLVFASADGGLYVQQLAPDRMQLFVVQGEGFADGLRVPAGFTTFAPLDYDPDADWDLISGPWSPPRPWTQQEFQYLQPITGTPSNLLHYPIRLPGVAIAQVPPPAVCVPPPGWVGTYPVQPGDTLVSIAERFNLDVFSLAEGNCLENPNLIQVGQIINVPGLPPAPTNTPSPTTPQPPPPTAPQRRVEVFSGNGQSTQVGTGFNQPLAARVLDENGTPQANVTVTFTAPSGAPGAVFAGGAATATAVTDASGVATSPPLTAAGCPEGSFSVTASAPDAAPASFGLGATPPSAVVTSPDDAGPGTLRDIIAIVCPNQTITFANPVTNIVLLSGELLIDKSLTIQATDPVNQSVSANGEGRVFNITAGTVTINSLQITNGGVLGDSGGNIYNAGVLTLNNAIVNLGDADNGGSIVNTGTLTVNGGTITGGDAGNQGGGVFNVGNLTLNNVNLNGNNGAGDGGAVYNLGNLSVNNSVFVANTSNGGAIYNAAGATANITGSSFEGNGPFNAVFNAGGTMNIKESSILNGPVGSVALQNNGGTTNILNSTLTGHAFGIRVDAGAGSVVNASFVTIANNNAFGVEVLNGMLNLRNAILVTNGMANCVGGGAIIATGYNVSTDAACGPAFVVNPVGLAALQGTPPYFPLAAGVNPARDTVADCTAIGGAAVTTSQNGAARPTGAACNAGAYED